MTQPLSGVRILDLTTALSGPFASMTLADLGAEVLKIESPAGDDTRDMPPYYIGSDSAYFLSVNRGKKGIALNLKTQAGLDVFYDLVRVADIVLDNFRPGVTSRLRIDHDMLTSINPRIITCSMSGFGSVGEYANRPGFDAIIQGFSGVISITGIPDGPPIKSGVPIGDLAGSLYAAIAVMGSLMMRSQTGTGNRATLSLLEADVSLLSYLATYYLVAGDVARPQGAGHRSGAPSNAYLCSDGKWIVIVASQAKFFRRLAAALQEPTLADDERFRENDARGLNRVALDEILKERFISAPRAHWLQSMAASDVPCGPVYTIDEVFDDPQIIGLELLQTVEGSDGSSLPYVRLPITFAESNRETSFPPRYGQHTRETLTSLLNYSDERIKQLLDVGAILEAPERSVEPHP